MKKISLLIAPVILGCTLFAQQNPTGGPGNSRDWTRGGNLAAPPGLGGTNNIFGTMWNSPIYTYTKGVARMIIAGGFGGSNQGRIAMGNDLTGFTPLARLHLHQTGGSTFAHFSNPSNPNLTN